MSKLLPRFMAYLHTPQICGLCRGVKVGIRGLLNWTAEKLFLGLLLTRLFVLVSRLGYVGVKKTLNV
jgi:hypothetical protein